MAFYILGRHYFCSWVFGACLILGLLFYISGVQAQSGLIPLYSLPCHFPGGYFGSFGNKPLPDLSQPDFNPELTNVFPPPKHSPQLDHIRVYSPNPFNVYAVNLKPSAGTVCHTEAYPPDDRKLWRCYHGTGRQTVSIDLFLTQADDEASVSLAPNQIMTAHYAPSFSVEMPEGMPGVNQQPEPLFELFRNDGVNMVENHLRQQSQRQVKVSKALQITSSMMDTSFWQGLDDQTAQWIQSINFKIINGYYKEEEEVQKRPDEYRSGDLNIAVGLDDILLGPGASIQLSADIAFPGVINRLAGGGDEKKSSGIPQEGHGESSAESNAEGSAGGSTKSDEATSTDSSGESHPSSTQRRIPVKNAKRPQNLYTWVKSQWYGNDLQRAVEIGDLNAIETLMAQGVHPDTTGESGQTPLLTAARCNDPDVARILLTNGANPDLDTRKGTAPLLFAAKFGLFAFAKVLLEYNADPNISISEIPEITPLHHACRYSHLNICKLLLDYGAEPEPCLFYDESYDQPLLHKAAEYGSLDVVKTLMAKGVDPNIRAKDGDAPLRGASMAGYVDIVRVLLNHGADPNIHTLGTPFIRPLTPLQAAAISGHVDVVRVLLNHGADPNLLVTWVLSHQTQTTLHDAAQGHLNIVKIMLESGANPNSLDWSLRTPLHLAAREGHLSVVKALLANGADIRLRTREGLAALDCAKGAEVQELIRNFISSSHPLQHLYLVSIRTWLVEHRTEGQSFESAIRSLPLPTQIKRLIFSPPYPEDRKDSEDSEDSETDGK